MKVTLGRWSAEGVVPLSPTFDTPGLLARSVADAAYGFMALDPAGMDPVGFVTRAAARDLAGVRIGCGDLFLWQECDAGIAETALEAVRNAETVSARDYLARIARLRALARSAAPRLDAVDVIASPTLCLTPLVISEVADADSHLQANSRIVRNTVAVNYLGLCAITLPVGRDPAGMPVGLQLTAAAGAEERLLAIALTAERALGTAADRLGTPPLLAT